MKNMGMIWDDGRFIIDVYKLNNSKKFINEMKELFGSCLFLGENKYILVNIINHNEYRQKFLDLCENWLKSEIETCFNGNSLEFTSIYEGKEFYEDFKEMYNKVNEFYKNMCIERKGILKEFCASTDEYL